MLWLDSLTVSLHSPNGGHLSSIKAVEGTTIDGPWKMVEIPTSDMSPQSFLTGAIPTYNKTDQLKKGDTN